LSLQGSPPPGEGEPDHTRLIWVKARERQPTRVRCGIAIGCGRQAGGIKQWLVVNRRAEEHVMGMGRGAPSRMRAGFVQLCGLVLAFGVLGAAPDPAAAAYVDLGQSFEILDEDGDGVVGRGEFLRRKTAIFYRALTDMDRDQRLNPGEINLTPEAFADADLDGDRKLSGAEFVQARFMQFEAIDADGDQEITADEFRTFMAPYHL
jgi:Ca2+-binding EF-hand superfamily protein